MRLSTLAGDAGFSPAHNRRPRVLYNGQALKDCVLADERLGLAVCLVRDADGQPVRDADDPERFTVTIKPRGAVVITFAANHSERVAELKRRRVRRAQRKARRVMRLAHA